MGKRRAVQIFEVNLLEQGPEPHEQNASGPPAGRRQRRRRGGWREADEAGQERTTGADMDHQPVVPTQGLLKSRYGRGRQSRRPAPRDARSDDRRSRGNSASRMLPRHCRRPHRHRSRTRVRHRVHVHPQTGRVNHLRRVRPAPAALAGDLGPEAQRVHPEFPKTKPAPCWGCGASRNVRSRCSVSASPTSHSHITSACHLSSFSAAKCSWSRSLLRVIFLVQ